MVRTAGRTRVVVRANRAPVVERHPGSDVYATSARLWLSEQELAGAPASGGVFKFATDVTGLAEQRFGV